MILLQNVYIHTKQNIEPSENETDKIQRDTADMRIVNWCEREKDENKE